MLPPELILKILSYTDYKTLKNYREFDKEFIDNNIKLIFRRLCLKYPFLRYGNPNIKNFIDFENTWHMEQYEVEFEDYIFYIREFNVRKKNTLYFLMINNIFHKNITFHAVNNLKDSNIKYFKKLCDENKDNYFQNYIHSIYF
tara:strand:- start:34 stop:462 length:429 start_codon:yes stop_codon:yes gene_type:complete